MRYLKLSLLLVTLVSLGTGCVSKKKFNETNAALEATKNLLDDCEKLRKGMESQVADLTANLDMANKNLKKANEDLMSANSKLKSAEDQLLVLRNSQSSLLDQLNAASVINKAGAESIKKSLDAISQQSNYIKELTQKMQYKDSVNLALAMNLKRSLKDFNDSDVSVEVKKGVVYISLSDNMLFKTASASINSGAMNVLGKIASILNDQKDLDILVEGHTDNVPMTGECVTDNWDLSSRRALSVVKALQSKYKVDPARMTAGARGEYAPKATNKTAAGRQSNRRTEIIVLPKLDQFFKLMEAPQGK